MTLKEVLTTTAHYHRDDEQLVFQGLRASVIALFLLGERENYTLLEVTQRLRQARFDVSDSTVSPRLHELKGLGLICDDGPKRPCRENHRLKKTWRLADGARDLVLLSCPEEAAGGAS